MSTLEVNSAIQEPESDFLNPSNINDEKESQHDTEIKLGCGEDLDQNLASILPINVVTPAEDKFLQHSTLQLPQTTRNESSQNLERLNRHDFIRNILIRQSTGVTKRNELIKRPSQGRGSQDNLKSEKKSKKQKTNKKKQRLPELVHSSSVSKINNDVSSKPSIQPPETIMVVEHPLNEDQFDHKLFDRLDNIIAKQQTYINKNKMNYERTLVRIYRLEALKSEKAQTIIKELNKTNTIKVPMCPKGKKKNRKNKESPVKQQQMQIQFLIKYMNQ